MIVKTVISNINASLKISYLLFDDLTISGFSFPSAGFSAILILLPITFILFAGTKPACSDLDGCTLEFSDDAANNQPLMPVGCNSLGANRMLWPLNILNSASSLASKSCKTSAT